MTTPALPQAPTPPRVPPEAGRPDTDRALFWLPVLTLALCWIIVPTKIVPNFRPETLQTLAAGQNWQPALLGHGALTCFLADVFYDATRRAPWAPYFVAQMCVVLSLFICRALAKRFLPERQAFAAAMAMLSFCFFNIDSTMLCGTVTTPIFWLGAIFFYHRALTEGKTADWARTGLCLGLGMYCSPIIADLALAMLICQILPKAPQRRLSDQRFFPGPALTAAVFALLVTPLVVWAFRHDGAGLFLPPSAPSLCPVPEVPRFFGALGIIALLMLLPLLPMSALFQKRSDTDTADGGKEAANALFLAVMFCTPIVTLGCRHLQAARAGQIFYLLPIFFLFHCGKKDPSPARQWTGLALAVAVPVLILAAGSLVVLRYPARTGRPLSCHFPGRPLSWAVWNQWRSSGAFTPLPFVRGEERLANNASVYGPNRPRVWSEEWASEEDFDRQGGIWIWDDNDPDKELIIAAIKERYPRAEFSASFLIPYRTKTKIPPLCVSMAVIPPRGGFLPPDIVPPH